MDAVVKSSLYLASILLLGAGVTSRFVLPSLRDAALSRRLRWGVLTGAVVVLIGSGLDILLTLHGILGFVDMPLVQNYLMNTRHGRAILVRLALVAVVLALALTGLGRGNATAEDGNAGRPEARWSITNVLFVLAGVTLLGTFSWTSHAAAMGGTPPLLADLVHYGAATVWAGPILYLALYPHWHEHQPALRKAFQHISRIGLVSVLLLFATGAYTALIHMQNPERFVASPYGLALGAKLAVVLLIIGIAALNRFWLLPAFLNAERSERFRTAVRSEALLLVTVFVLTGVLTTSALPHEGGAQPTVAENLVAFLRFLTGRCIYDGIDSGERRTYWRTCRAGGLLRERMWDVARFTCASRFRQ